jgi:hypothetical protein
MVLINGLSDPFGSHPVTAVMTFFSGSNLIFYGPQEGFAVYWMAFWVMFY